MKSYIVDYVKEPNLKEVWDKIKTISLYSPWKKYYNGYTTEAKLFHTNKAIYIKINSTETDIVAKRIKRNSLVCLESCMEFFLSPDIEDERYFNFEINAKGTMFSGICRYRKDLRKIRDDVKQFDVKTMITKDGWEIYIKIPFSFIRKYFNQISPIMRGNVYKCAETTKKPHFDVWSEVLTDKPEFHCSKYFGEFKLAGWSEIN